MVHTPSSFNIIGHPINEIHIVSDIGTSLKRLSLIG